MDTMPDEANSMWGLAEVAAAIRRRTSDALVLHRRALELRRDIGDGLGLTDSLVGLATRWLESNRGAARLVSASTAMRDRRRADADAGRQRRSRRPWPASRRRAARTSPKLFATPTPSWTKMRWWHWPCGSGTCEYE